MKILRTCLKQVTGALILTTLFFTQAYGQDTPELTDPEIAHVAVTANQIDINYAKIAKERTSNEKVLNFAQAMIDDHSAIINMAAALAKDLGVTPQKNAVSKSLLAGEKKTTKMLKTVDAEDFDAAYVKNEVAYHKAVINAVQNILIPQADNDRLRDLLKSVMPLLESHLEHAEMVYTKLTGSGY